jgi:hypothetical protein
MTWFKADDMLADHPKVIGLGKDAVPAMGLWLLVGTWAARYSTDGFVPDDMVRRYDPRRRLSKRLVEVGLWDRVGAGYCYHDWFDHQLSAEEVEKKRANNRERQRRHRQRNGRFGTDPSGPGAGTKTARQPDDQPEQVADAESSRVTDTSPNGSSNALHNALVTSTPTRPDPTRTSSSGNQGGGSTEPNARTINESPPKRPRCERHRNLADDDPGPPCHGCRHAREIAEGATAEAAAAGRRQRAEHRAQVDQCDDCDEYGWLLDDHRRHPVEPARRCTHRPLRVVS